ncbi:hypothetical protein JGK44_000029 [Shewanella algae]|uniref:hypothetical protein n=1 Tax=Shewanella algae TaxID=38313 RepID=UPI0034D5BCCD|nr:hypothetical protein [Shewanella algae]
MTRKKKVIIGLIAFVAFNMYIYKGAHEVANRELEELDEECRLLVGPSSSQYPSSKYYIAGETELMKELDKLNIISETTSQCRQFAAGSHDSNECIFITYWDSSTASESVKSTAIAAVKIYTARYGKQMEEHSERCIDNLRAVSKKNDIRRLLDAFDRKMGNGWQEVFPPFHWYYEAFLKW